METKWKRFDAMGTEIVITAVLEYHQFNLLDKAEEIIKDFEARFSRFLANSELSQFNNSNQEIIKVSPMMAEMLSLAKNLHLESSGVFDPTIIGSLEKVGYDKNFIDIKNSDYKPDLELIKNNFKSRALLDKLEINGVEVKKPIGLRLDFGGFGKGFIADSLSRTLFNEIKNYWISAGGDLLVCGAELGKETWHVGIQNPLKPETEIFAFNTHGAKLGIATSGVFMRQGEMGGFIWNHLIDPRSGLPAVNDILAVSAVAESAVKADVLAKTVLILGREAGLTYVDSQSESAVLIFFKDGHVEFSKRALNYF